jgi:hypothetical protein
MHDHAYLAAAAPNYVELLGCMHDHAYLAAAAAAAAYTTVALLPLCCR